MKKNRFKRINKCLCCELLLREGLQSKKRVTKLVLAIITVFTGYNDGGGDYDHVVPNCKWLKSTGVKYWENKICLNFFTSLLGANPSGFGAKKLQPEGMGT